MNCIQTNSNNVNSVVINRLIKFFLLLLFAVFLFLMIDKKNLPMFITFLYVAVILFYPMRYDFGKLLALIYVWLLVFLVYRKVIDFNFIPQAKDLLDMNPNIFYWLSIGHAHAVRLLVAYPGYIMSIVFGVTLNEGFSYYCIFMYLLMYLNILDSSRNIKVFKGHILYKLKDVLCLFPMIILTFLMNGRLVAAFFGFSILVDLFCKVFNDIKVNMVSVIIVISFGFLFTTVSSGTMMVSFIYIVAMIYFRNKNNLNKKRFGFTFAIMLILFMPIIIEIFQYIYFMFMRNVNYFGGGIEGFINMMQHGVGRYFINNPFIFLFFIIAAMFIILFNIRFIRRQEIKNYNFLPVIIAVNISIYGLLFGHSTGLMAVVPLIIIMLKYI